MAKPHNANKAYDLEHQDTIEWEVEAEEEAVAAVAEELDDAEGKAVSEPPGHFVSDKRLELCNTLTTSVAPSSGHFVRYKRLELCNTLVSWL
mmetsp:Transcript_32038/g.63124  ORF Transcript_32038/g.63124 Transcript_32038/m.63124 type:complete len:92 (-) Transcript_32038:693-968(-)